MPTGTHLKVSTGVFAANLIKQVKPVSPENAKGKRIKGTVVIQVIVGTDGLVKATKVVSGDPVLAAAALDAVKQFEYKPYLLNKQPVVVESLVNVDFK